MTWTKHDGYTLEDCLSLFRYENGKLYRIKDVSNTAKTGYLAGTKATNGYHTVVINKKRTCIHRVIFFMHHGYLPEVVDHINGIKDDNRIENLRASNYSLNGFSYRKKTGKSSKYRGVSFIKRDKRFQAKIKICGKSINLGYFKSDIDAAKAYDKKAYEVAGNHACLNFPR